MPSERLFTPKRRDVAFVVVALALFVAPLWFPALHVADPTYRYERVPVTVDDDGLGYAAHAGYPPHYAISDEIGCSVLQDVRPCAFERYLAENHTIPTQVYATNPGETDLPGALAVERYRYVVVDGTFYETAYVANQSVQNDRGMYRVDLSLEPTTADEVLRRVSIDASSPGDSTPSVVVEAAENGVAKSHERVDLPQTPLRTSDGEYYRVYRSDRNEASPLAQFVGDAFPFAAPFAGLLVLGRVYRRVDVTYVGSDRRR